MLVGIDVFGKRRGKGLGGGGRIPCSGGRLSAGGGHFTGQVADFLVWGNAKALDLLFERADRSDLANAGGDAERQEIARDIKGAGRDVAAIGLKLEGRRTRDLLAEVIEKTAMEVLAERRSEAASRYRSAAAASNSGGVISPPRLKF
jgi:hypothetical protein